MTVVYLDRLKYLLILGCLALCFGVGLLIGHFGIQSNSNLMRDRNGLDRRDAQDLKNSIEETIEAVDADSIRSFLLTLTKVPHLAASDRDR